MNAPEHFFLPDVQSAADTRRLAIQNVGVKGLRYPVQLDENGVMLARVFHYQAKLLGKGGAQVMRGVSHLKFDAGGRVNYHRDYWDAAEELYMKLPAIGLLMRGLRRALAA